MSNLIYAILFLIAAQIFVWFQLNGQFVWDGFKNNHTLIAFLFAFPVSWLFITYQKYAYLVFDKSLWSVRMFGFGGGMIVFLLLTWLLTGETINFKNAICLVLAFGIILVQSFVK